MSYIADDRDPPVRIAWSHPKSGGIWVFIASERNDPRFDELKRRADELQASFDISRTERLSEIDILRSEGARFYENIADCDLAVARVRDKGLSMPNSDRIPADWPRNWHLILNNRCWSGNNWLNFPEDGGVWILRELTKEQVHLIMQEVYRRQVDIANTSASLLVNDIRQQGGTFYSNVNDPAIPPSCRGRYIPVGPEPHEPEYWVDKPAPWENMSPEEEIPDGLDNWT